MNCSANCGTKPRRVTAIGPLPPPVNGQSVVFKHLVNEFAKNRWDLRVIDTGGGESRGWTRSLIKLWRSVQSCWAAVHADSVYIAIKAGRGMWLNTATAVVARLGRAQLFLHHHSYAYVRTRKCKMVALALVAGPQATHIVLTQSMADEFQSKTPEVRKTLILGNAVVVDKQLARLPLKVDSDEITIGHLSNLSLDKGIAETVDLAVALRRAGVRAGLVVAGPTADAESLAQIRRASAELGASFRYLGPVSGKKKLEFFQQISHFAFPSRYEHEAVPLVLYEAMAAGVVPLATRQGAISEQIAAAPSVLAESSNSFVAQTGPLLLARSVARRDSTHCRQAFLQALFEGEQQLSELIRRIESRS